MGRLVLTAQISEIESEPAVDAAIRKLATDILTEAQAKAPVDTGRLRASGFVDGENSEYTVGFDTEYAAYVEHGTSHMNPQPYLTPAALKSRGSL